MISKSIVIHDLIFTNTFFYKRNYAFFARLFNISIPTNIQSSIQINKIYPIRFGPFSPIYFCKVKEHISKDPNQQDILRCIVYILQTDYKRLARKNVVGRNQFLTSTKMIQIPLTLFCVLALLTEFHNWESADIIIDEFATIKEVNILMIPLTHFLNYCAYRKAVESKTSFRRLSNNRSRPMIDDIKLVFYDCSMPINELVKHKRLISYTESRFNVNTSFISLKTQSPSNLMNMAISNTHDQYQEIQTKRKRGRPSAKPKVIKQEEYLEIDQAHESPQSAQLASAEVSLKRNKRRRFSEYVESPPRKIKTRSTANIVDSNESEEGSTYETIESSPETKYPRRSTRKNVKSKTVDSLAQHSSKKKPKNAKKSISPIDSTYEQERMEAGAKLLERWPTRQEFNEEYIQFYHKRYNQAPRAPKMGWTEIDFYTLFAETVRRGGYRIVTSKQLWKDVYKELNSSNVVSNAATTIRVHYAKLMRGFEEYYFPEPFSVSQGNDTLNISGNSEKPEMYNTNIDMHMHSSCKFSDFNVNSILNSNGHAPQKNMKPMEHRPYGDSRNYNYNCYNYPPNYNYTNYPMYYPHDMYSHYPPPDYYNYYPQYPMEDYYNHYPPMYSYPDPAINHTPYHSPYDNMNGISHPPPGMPYPYPPPLSSSHMAPHRMYHGESSEPPTYPRQHESRHYIPHKL